MKISGREIACGLKPFLIAEAGLNHNGDESIAVSMAWVAKDAGCDAVKYQTYRTDQFCRPDDPMYTVFKKCELREDFWPYLKNQCDKAGIVFLSTPQNPSDLDILLKTGIPAIKIGSDDLTNLEMLKYCARDDVGLPIILSTGMSDTTEILKALQELKSCDKAILVCTSQYPAPSSEANLGRIRTWQIGGKLPIGFSDHTIGNTASIVATSLRAAIIEKHFTLSHDLPGPDHKWSMDPTEMRSWVQSVHEAYETMGDGKFILSEKEAEQKRKYQRTYVGLRGIA